MILITFEDEETCEIGVTIDLAHGQRVTKAVEDPRRNYGVGTRSISKS